MIYVYDLVLEHDTKRTYLQLKDSFAYPLKNFRNPSAIYELMTETFRLDTRADEFVYLAAFDCSMQLIALFEISHGTVNLSLLEPRGVFVRALQIGACSIMLMHNHPSGNTAPSKCDIHTCKRIKKAGELLNVPLTDFIIIGNGEYTSFKEKKLL